MVITLYNIIAFALPAAGFKPWDDGMWFNWMMFYLMVHVVLAPVTAVWMTWGGIRDLREMYRRLSALTRSQDDGYVPEPRKDD